MKYIGVKIVDAKIMTRKAYNDLRGWELPADENGSDAGYLKDDGHGHIQWDPIETFDRDFRRMSGMTFGLATEAAMKGYAVMRPGWNGGGMCLKVQIPDEHSKMTHPYLYMTIPGCTEGTRLLPWQPAQVDVFANDWMITE